MSFPPFPSHSPLVETIWPWYFAASREIRIDPDSTGTLFFFALHKRYTYHSVLRFLSLNNLSCRFCQDTSFYFLLSRWHFFLYKGGFLNLKGVAQGSGLVEIMWGLDPLEKEMATQSSTLAWKTPWTEEPGRLQSMGLQRVGDDWATSLSLFSVWLGV